MTARPSELSLDELRQRRRLLQERDDAVSYVRRVAQGRADLARAELARRESGGGSPELADELRHVLGDRLLGASDRPPRPAEDFSDDPRADQLDRLCAERGFGRLVELEDTAVAELAAALEVFEGEVSDERQRLFAELDDLSEELVRRYREQQPPGDDDQ
jgi:RsiG-like